jgi:hypothetical protein
MIKNDFNNLKKILFISRVINNKISNGKLNKKNFYNKYEKTNKITLSGMNSGIEIRPVITYHSPFDKPIQLKFKTNINIDNILLELNDTKISFELNQKDFFPDNLSIDELVTNINKYINGVKKLESNIYQEFEILPDNKNPDEITFSNNNKFKIIEWNLELKKFFCLIWKVMEKIIEEFNIFFKNVSKNNINKNVLFFLQDELNLDNSNLKLNFDNFGKQINLIIVLLIEIKNIFDLADIDKNLLSFNTINLITDKYIFVLDYIIKNLSKVDYLE